MTAPRVGDDASVVERVLALKTFPVLAELDADELVAIAERARAVRLPRGTVLLGEGEAAEALHLVLDGEVDEHRGGGAPRRRRAPHVVGGLEALAGAPGDTVVAASDVEALDLGGAGRLWELLEESFDLTLACLANLAGATGVIRRRLVPSGGHPAPEADVPFVVPEALAAQITAMRRRGPLADAPIHALGLLAEEGAILRADAGRRLWSIDDEADRVLVVLAGRVRGTSPAGHAFEHGTGAIVGADAALAGEPRWYDLTATAACVLLDLPAERLVDVLEDDWPMAAHVLRVVARELASLRTRDAAIPRKETTT